MRVLVLYATWEAPHFSLEQIYKLVFLPCKHDVGKPIALPKHSKENVKWLYKKLSNKFEFDMFWRLPSNT